MLTKIRVVFSNRLYHHGYPSPQRLLTAINSILTPVRDGHAHGTRYMYTNHPDLSYYANGRWDHAYMQEDHTKGGFVAFPVATPKGAPGPGLQRSLDGTYFRMRLDYLFFL